MRNFICIVVITAFLNTAFVSANDIRDTEPKNARALTSQIYGMLGEDWIPNEIRGQKAEVRLAVDGKGIVSILSITTESDMLAKYLRENIDFQEIRKGSYVEGIIYRVPIEVVL
ncbi:hypothetical protein [Maribacter antarcticus]|uniref:hypothetical protein n=1 Tax=Maribacter antarcticus TaxID=505250 RepID=UPI00047E4998|nr:hypothetical protein [Maribacter antarcticus]